MRRIAIILILLATVAVLPAAGRRDPLPVVVADEFVRAWPNAVILSSVKGAGSTGVTYTIEFRNLGKSHRAVYTRGGILLSINEPMSVTDLPEPVLRSIRRRFPRGAVTNIRRAGIGDYPEYQMTVNGVTLRLDHLGNPAGGN